MKLSYFKVLGVAIIVLLWIDLVVLPIIIEIDLFHPFALEDETGKYLLLEDGTKVYKSKSPFDFPLSLTIGMLFSLVITYFIKKQWIKQ